jgi:hypothetical protein
VPRDDNYLSRGIAHVKFRGVCCVPLIGVPAGHQLRWSSPGYSCRLLYLLAVSEADFRGTVSLPERDVLHLRLSLS